jgi:protein-disulfide isomerase
MAGMRHLAVLVLAASVVLTAGSTANIKGNTYGDPKAPLLLEVFSDFQCPGCKGFHDDQFQRLMKDYVVPGKMYVIYRYFPLQMHPHAQSCAEYACAAARVQKYAKVAEALFADQVSIANTGKVEEVVAKVLSPTEMKMVKSLLKSPDVQKEIQVDIEEGKTVPVMSTPTLWVTAKGKSQAVTWPMEYSLLKTYLDGLLKK